jgi:hypothetical protein
VEVTKANLTALQTVVGELEKSRASSKRSSTALIWLMVAIFVTGAVVAPVAAPQLVYEFKTAPGVCSRRIRSKAALPRPKTFGDGLHYALNARDR